MIPPDGGPARAADPRAETTRTLTIGYLQVGPIEHGICRYGRLVASEGRQRQDLVILEHNTRLTGGLRRDYFLFAMPLGHSVAPTWCTSRSAWP